MINKFLSQTCLPRVMSETLYQRITNWFGLKDEDDNEGKTQETKQDKSRTEQPAIWDKMPKNMKIKYPIITTGHWQNTYVNRMKNLEKMLRVRIHKYDKYNSSLNKAKGIHERMHANHMISRMVSNYNQLSTLSLNYSRPKPVFIYVGSFYDGTIYGVVLDKDGQNEATYYSKSAAPRHVEKLWNDILCGFDWGGAIQCVVLMDEFYKIAKKNFCPVLEEGNNLLEVWDNDLNQMKNGEVNYEALGFCKGMFEEVPSTKRYSSAGFCCINTFDKNMRPHIYYGYDSGLVWHINDTHLMLVRPKTGEIWEKYSIRGKNEEFIAEKIIAECELI